MSKNQKSKPESTTSELYYEMNVEKLVIYVQKGGKVVFQSGNPSQPPPKPPGGGH